MTWLLAAFGGALIVLGLTDTRTIGGTLFEVSLGIVFLIMALAIHYGDNVKGPH